MKRSRFIALSDIYGHITSIVLISLLAIPPCSTMRVNRTALQDSVNNQWSAIFRVFDPDCNFTVLTYYHAYQTFNWDKNQPPLIEYDYWRKFDLTRLFPALQKELFSPGIFSRRDFKDNSQLSKKSSPLSIAKDQATVQNYSKAGNCESPGLYIPVFPEPIVYRSSSGQQITILPVDIDQFHLIEGLDTYYPDEWIQDHFTVLRGADNEPVLLEPINYISKTSQVANHSIADHLAAMCDITLKPSIYDIVGGNILVTDTSCAFIEIDHRLKGADEKLKQDLGVNTICWLGAPSHKDAEGWIPLALPNPCSAYSDQLQHTDMYVTPAGKDSTGKELILVGRIEDYCLLTNSKNQNYREARKRMNCINEYLDTLQAQIERCSPEFVVRRLPLVLEEQTNGGFALRTYNNCITEMYFDTLSQQTIKRIYLPDYTFTLRANNPFTAIQQKVVDSLTAYGFNDIRWIQKDFIQATDREGSLHCLVKVLSRTP